MSSITQTDIDNGKRDLDDLGQVVNGAVDLNGTGTLSTRLGVVLKTLLKQEVSTSEDRIAAAASADEAEASAASINVDKTGNALSYIRVNAAENAFEILTPAQVLAAIGGLATDGDGSALTGVRVIGEVAAFAFTTVPTGWLECDGSTVLRTTYSALFTAIGTTFGAGNGSTTFKIPDLRGEFVRGWDDTRGIDSSRAFGSAQADALDAHNHLTVVDTASSGGFSWAGGDHIRQSGSYGDSTYRLQGSNGTPSEGLTSDTGGNETRPRNIAMMYCIKF